jgi:pheromone shutdown-related protein TraB
MPTEELTLAGKTVILVGTAHVSDESVKAVEEAILKYKPDVVAVELCQQRYQALKEEKRWEETDIMEVINSGRTHLFLLQILLANFQRKLGEDVGIKPGAEMMKAIEIAEREKIGVLLADRDIKVTLKRAMDMMSLKEKAKILYGFVEGFVEGEKIDKELIEKLKEKDVLTELMEELAVETPSVKKVLVDERDAYIANTIHASGGKTIVAVVGAGHMAGIKRHLTELSGKILVTHSLSIGGEAVAKSGGKKLKLVSLAVPVFFLATFVWIFIRYGSDMTWSMLIRLFLLQGTGAALGTALALGHPLSILAAFLTAPFAFIHPFIAVGWIAAYVEVKVRKPRVIDFKNLMYLKTTADYWNNRVVKLILIMAFANLGSTIGSATWLVSWLFR